MIVEVAAGEIHRPVLRQLDAVDRQAGSGERQRDAPGAHG
jgi:hypothetical protein